MCKTADKIHLYETLTLGEIRPKTVKLISYSLNVVYIKFSAAWNRIFAM